MVCWSCHMPTCGKKARSDLAQVHQPILMPLARSVEEAVTDRARQVGGGYANLSGRPRPWLRSPRRWSR